jgi:hypothetical protein
MSRGATPPNDTQSEIPINKLRNRLEQMDNLISRFSLNQGGANADTLIVQVSLKDNASSNEFIMGFIQIPEVNPDRWDLIEARDSSVVLCRDDEVGTPISDLRIE